MTPEVTNVTIEDFNVPGQTLQTVDTDAEMLPMDTPEVALSEETLEQERQAQEAEEGARKAAAQHAANANAHNNFAPLGKDIPAGEGAQGIVDAAKAQLGVAQDCTDLVQNSLAAIGVIDQRDMGGFDLGPSSSEHVALGGTVVTSGDYAPGDVLFWEGRHNAIYISAMGRLHTAATTGTRRSSRARTSTGHRIPLSASDKRVLLLRPGSMLSLFVS